MKQTAMTISINSSVNNNQNGEQRMTSLEIAQLSGKQHKDVLKAIRNMESAWEKVNGRNFALVDVITQNPLIAHFLKYDFGVGSDFETDTAKAVRVS